MPNTNLTWLERASESKFIASVWACTAVRETSRTVLADPSISISLVSDTKGSRVVLRGSETRPRTERLPAGYACTTIRLQPGVVLEGFDARQFLNRWMTIPANIASNFCLNGARLHYPDFYNAEQLIEQLDNLGRLTYEPASSRDHILLPHTYARLVKRTTGLSPYQLRQLLRLHQAFRLLKQGLPAGAVAAELDFVDQSHLTKISKQFFGHTPNQLRTLPQIP